MISLYLCLLTFSTCVMSVQAAKTSCTVPSVWEMQSTTLTCHLPEDVSQSKKDFTVYHYSGKENPDDVLSCLWTDDQPTCDIKKGYVFDYAVSDTITLGIPRVTKDKIGKYTCQIKNMKVEDMEFCELSVLTGKTTCEVQSVELMSNTSLHCYFPEDISQSKTNFAIYHTKKLGSEDCVVSCVWVLDQLKCFTSKGYECDETVTDNFTLHIPRVTADKAGKYSCKMSGSKAEDTSVCELSAKGETICDVKVMPMASLHCYFSEDIGHSKKDFEIYHTNDYKSQERVAVFMRMSDKLKCTVSEGYECDETVSDNFTLHIPRVTAEKAGKYTCKILGSKEDVIFCKVSTGVEKTGEHMEENSPAVIASITITVIITTAFLLLVLVICLRRKISCSQTVREHITPEHQTKITIDHTEGQQTSSAPRSGQQSEQSSVWRKMWRFFRRIRQRIIGTTSIQEEGPQYQRETEVPLLHNDQQQASTRKPSHWNSFTETLQVFNESEKRENPSPRLSLQLETSENFGGEPDPLLEKKESFGGEPYPELKTKESFGGEPYPELETKENFGGEPYPELETKENFGGEPYPELETKESFGGEPYPELETKESFGGEPYPELETRENFGGEPYPELETRESFGDELWRRPLHMDPADNSKEEATLKGNPLPYPKQNKKKKKKLKDLEERGDVDDLREGELRGQTANKEGEKEKRKSWTSLLKSKLQRKKQKEDIGHKKSTENRPQAEAQSLTPLKQKLLMGEHSDSDEATNASLARERPQEKIKEQTFQKNRMRHTYSPGREPPMQRDLERESFPQEARRRRKNRNKQGNKSGSPRHPQEASDREGADNPTHIQTAREDSKEKSGKEKTK